ncbi:MAG: YciI family protein [Chloroflexi bacterium]|nr:YciI family protein [Chloroflexota bacterium]MDA1146028.1 YciI family protein [Chloroflexota bacterium]
MANYLLAYHGGGMPEDEAAGQKVMAAWMAWFEKLGAAVVDGGNPVGASVTIASNGATSEGGGANPATGYSVVQAESLAAATELAKGCPILTSGGSIEVGETFNAM